MTDGETIVVELLRPDVATRPHVAPARPYASGRVGKSWRKAPTTANVFEDEDERAASAWAQSILGAVESSNKAPKARVGPWYSANLMGTERHDGNYPGYLKRHRVGLGFPPKATRKNQPAGAWDKSLKAGHTRPTKPRWDEPRRDHAPPVAPATPIADSKTREARNAERRAAAAAARRKGRKSPPPRPKSAAAAPKPWRPTRTAEGLLFGDLPPAMAKRPHSAGR